MGTLVWAATHWHQKTEGLFDPPCWWPMANNSMYDEQKLYFNQHITAFSNTRWPRVACFLFKLSCRLGSGYKTGWLPRQTNIDTEADTHTQSKYTSHLQQWWITRMTYTHTHWGDFGHIWFLRGTRPDPKLLLPKHEPLNYKSFPGYSTEEVTGS